eukprot:SAG31_NODE_2556_length_5495_cov_27.724055_3_plen_231_part_00
MFSSPNLALAALADYDADLAGRWAQLLIEPITGSGLTIGDFDGSLDDEEIPTTAEALGKAIIAGCRWRLLKSRECSLCALRDGFVEHVDLRVQLGALSSAELMRMLRGNTDLSREDLLKCFQWPDLRAPDSSKIISRYLQEIILDESEAGLSAEQRLHMLEWCTALPALPCDGLRDLIILKIHAEADPNELPNVHTCTREVYLPAYTSRALLQEKLLRAVEHRHDGFQIE